MKTPARLLLAVLPLFAFAPAFAQHTVLTVNADASDVKFTLGGGHETEGTFHVTQGTIGFDPNATKLSGLIVVAAGSGKTGNDSRDKKMTTQVLEAAKFADVTFAPQSYTGTLAPSGDSTIQATGVFTLHGTPHDLTIPIQIHIDGNNCTAKATFPVPYLSWGLKDPSIFILKVAKEVQINLTLTGTLAH